MPEVNRRQYLLTMYKRAKKYKFDIEKYNVLRRDIAEIEHDLRRLRDPLTIQLPPNVNRCEHKPPAELTNNLANNSSAKGKVSSGTSTVQDTKSSSISAISIKPQRNFSSYPWPML